MQKQLGQFPRKTITPEAREIDSKSVPTLSKEEVVSPTIAPVALNDTSETDPNKSRSGITAPAAQRSSRVRKPPSKW